MSMLFCTIVKVSKESLRIATSMLSNNTETPLVFRMMTKAPFILVDMDPSTNVELSTRTISTQMQTLRPKHNLIVSIYTVIQRINFEHIVHMHLLWVFKIYLPFKLTKHLDIKWYSIFCNHLRIWLVLKFISYHI